MSPTAGSREFVMDRIKALKAKLAAREGKAEFAKNCEALRAEIARLEGSGPLAEFLKENAPEAGEGGQE
jgi:hypothetical protein